MSDEQKQEQLAAPTDSTIFVIVKVTYDWYRFQNNVGAATDLQIARQIASEHASCRGNKIPIIEDAKKSSNQDDSETTHIWIECWPNIPDEPTRASAGSTQSK